MYINPNLNPISKEVDRKQRTRNKINQNKTHNGVQAYSNKSMTRKLISHEPSMNVSLKDMVEMKKDSSMQKFTSPQTRIQQKYSLRANKNSKNFWKSKNTISKEILESPRDSIDRNSKKATGMQVDYIISLIQSKSFILYAKTLSDAIRQQNQEDQRFMYLTQQQQRKSSMKQSQQNNMNTLNNNFIVSTVTGLSSNGGDQFQDAFATKLMEKNFIEHCCEILFTEQDERFLLYALNEVPKVRNLLYKMNSQGWFPVFRVLNFFSGSTYGTKKQQQNLEIAEKLYNSLLRIDYDFMKPSKFKYQTLQSMSTFEMLMTVPCDQRIFSKLLEHIAVTQTDLYVTMITDMENGHGRLFELFHTLRDDVSLDFLNTIVNVHNEMVRKMGNGTATSSKLND